MTTKNVFSLLCAFHVCFSILLHGQTTKEHAGTIITGGIVVTMDGQRHIYDDGAVVVTGDTIIAVGPRAELEARYESRETIDAKDTLVLPGFINGMRGVLGETFIDFPAPDNKNEAAMLDYTEKFLKKWQGDPLIHAAPAPHSIYTCSQKTLQDASALARKYHAPILIHVAEMKKERDDSEKQNGMSPVQYLDKIGVLGSNVVAAHCIFVDEADRKILAQHNVGCVHNPSSNMMIASGVAPVPEMRAAGIAVGLGTDGPAGSNNDLDLMEEIDLAAKLAKITKMSPLALNALAVVEMATIDGARALHMEKEIGSLEKGKKADLILISLDEPNAVPMFDVYAQIAYALKASDVQTVMIGGRVVMRDHKLLTVNEQAAIAKARDYKKAIAASLGMP